MHMWNVNFFYESVTVQCVYSSRHQKRAGFHWFKYHYLHKNTPCSEDFSRPDSISYTEWSIRSRLFSNSGAVRFLQVCTGSKAGVKCYLLLIIYNILMSCKVKLLMVFHTVKRRQYTSIVCYGWVLFNCRARGNFSSVDFQVFSKKDRHR